MFNGEPLKCEEFYGTIHYVLSIVLRYLLTERNVKRCASRNHCFVLAVLHV